MRIALSCCGEGFGHASRLISLYEELKDRYTISIFCPSTVSPYIRGKIPDAEINYTPRFTFLKENGKINCLGTLRRNITTLALMPQSVHRLYRRLKHLDIEAVVTDFDPFTSLAAKKGRIPVLELNHPGIILRRFSLSPEALLSKMVVRFMESFYNQKICCSFYGSHHGPLIRREITSERPTRKDFYLVYLNGISLEDVRRLLEPFAGIPFQIFPDPKSNFQKALVSCKGVITTAGHQLISESIYLEKPLFVVPLKSQFEQRLNAKMVERSGWGMQGSLKNFQETLSRFLAERDSFPRPEQDRHTRFCFTNDKDHIIDSMEDFFQEAKARNRRISQTGLIRPPLKLFLQTKQ
ncbi:MAG: hypothetical protein JW760_09970 [Spirochaetales bacterium]|nr:hypothetical protein [Spirochaetales bacterium]